MNKVDKINEGIIDLKERKLQMTEDNIHKLELVKEILMLGRTDLMTIKMCAEYFEVSISAIKMLINRHKEEFEDNGLKVYSRKEINKMFSNLQDVTLEKISKYKDCLKSQDVTLEISNRGIMLINKRVLLNIGMLLRDSKVAKELRRRILDVVHDAEKTEVVDNVINEIRTEQEISQDMLQAIMSGDLVKESLLKTELLNLKNKRIEHLGGIVTNSLTITESKSIINKCIRTIASTKYNNNFGTTWNEFYKLVNYKLNINIKNRNGKGLSKFSDDEIKKMEIIAKSWCSELGININLKLN